MFNEYENSLETFLGILGESDPAKFTKREWHLVWSYIRSDFCTGVIDFMKWACVEHDYYFRTHTDFSGKVIGFMEANRRFLVRMIYLSNPFRESQNIALNAFGSLIGHANLMAWWRWAYVCLFTRRVWDRRESCHG